jgi:uncharacterized OB-fold protein
MSEEGPGKKLPVIHPVNRPYWQGTIKSELRLQRCQPCGHLRHPATEVCPRCLSTEFAWIAASGRGTIYSFVIVRQALDKAWAGDVPYCVAIVALDEGPHLLTNISGIEMEDITIGHPVEVFFEHVNDDIALPKFKPAAAATGTDAGAGIHQEVLK